MEYNLLKIIKYC